MNAATSWGDNLFFYMLTIYNYLKSQLIKKVNNQSNLIKDTSYANIIGF